MRQQEAHGGGAGAELHAQCRAAPGAEAQGYSEGPPAGESEAAAAAWDLFWGWDCCAPGGLCERVYARLGIARSSWTALKALPVVRCPLARTLQVHMHVAALACPALCFQASLMCSANDTGRVV